MAAVVREAGYMRCVGGHVIQVPYGRQFGHWGAGEGSFAFWHWAGFTLCHADRVADGVAAEGSERWWGGGFFLRCGGDGGEVLEAH